MSGPNERPRIVCREQGQGHPVVVVPWGPASYGSLYPYALQPLARRYRLVHWDYRGCGESSPADRYSVEDDAWDLAGVIEGMGLERPVLLGHSYGGMVALKLASEQPELLGGLVLVNTVSGSEALRAVQTRRRDHMGTVRFRNWQRTGLQAIGGGASGEDKLRYLEMEARNWNLDELQLQLVLRRLRVNFQVLAAIQPSLQNLELGSALGKLRVPTLVTAGHRDLLTGNHPRDLHLAIPDSRFHRFMESGHFPFLDRPTEFFRVVGDWLRDLDPGRKG